RYAFGSVYLGLGAFVIFYGLDWVATVPPTARLAADTFGRENVGIMFGWIAASHQLGAATAAYGGGLLHTWLGDYQVTFMSAGLVCLIAAGLVLPIGPAVRPGAARGVGGARARNARAGGRPRSPRGGSPGSAAPAAPARRTRTRPSRRVRPA